MHNYDNQMRHGAGLVDAAPSAWVNPPTVSGGIGGVSISGNMTEKPGRLRTIRADLERLANRIEALTGTVRKDADRAMGALPQGVEKDSAAGGHNGELAALEYLASHLHEQMDALSMAVARFGDL